MAPEVYESTTRTVCVVVILVFQLLRQHPVVIEDDLVPRGPTDQRKRVNTLVQCVKIKKPSTSWHPTHPRWEWEQATLVRRAYGTQSSAAGMSPAPRNMRHSRRSKSKSIKRTKQKALKLANAVSVDELLKDAKAYETAGQMQDAVSKLEQAVSLKPDDSEIYEELASLYLQLTRSDDALQAFRMAIKLKPNEGFEKYTYLAQLLGNTEEAVVSTRKGIELIKMEIMSIDKSEKARLQELREFQASAHCAVAEIFLGVIEERNDPALAKKLDVEVEKEIMEALALSVEGSASEQESLIALANLRLSQGRTVDAKEAMDDISDALIVSAMEKLPPMEIRIAVGKQLMEVDLWAEAEAVLSSVMYECDFNVEVWYLIAVTHWKRRQVSAARECLEQTRAILQRPDGYDGELEEVMIDKLYEELEKISNDPSEDVPVQ
ncbi:hypothetical protein FGB62_233g016 [Gracilaria domingensis]|nr:hypothetical protein FGB62_233g016 [Gracilaria domingensis]